MHSFKHDKISNYNVNSWFRIKNVYLKKDKSTVAVLVENDLNTFLEDIAINFSADDLKKFYINIPPKIVEITKKQFE